ncbi:MAG TPA: hypothetical protein VJW51_12515 [Candidatus Acidoferrales bacterium]|nr:hypothetical protein [Candidatus Acidoferrales bacterium]
MTYKKMNDGTYAVGYLHRGSFIAYTTAFDVKEAKALINVWRAVLDLFHATSGAWITVDGQDREITRGSTAKRKKKRNRKN